jgi:cell division septation protein DedD
MAAAPAASPTGGETRTVSPSDSALPDGGASEPSSDQPVLGSSKHSAPVAPEAPTQTVAAAPISSNFAPESGQEFLQVAALPRNEALSVADVLRKKGFRAHAVPVPGNTKLYRVIVGPVRDVADLSSTREDLRKTGFGKVIVQKY